MALCPAQTETDFFQDLGYQVATGGRMRTPDEVVATTFRGLRRGAPYVIDGWRYRLTANASRFLPRGLTARMTEKVLHPSKMTRPANPTPPLALAGDDADRTAA
jgi:short-subunit dehydrogenase